MTLKNDINNLQPLFSVVIPAFNSSATISDLLEEIVRQQKSDIEVIVVDDCSDDSSFALIDNFVKKYNWIYGFKNTNNKGPSFCRNLGLEKARGKYIIFLDSDDMIDEKYFEFIRQLSSRKDKIDVVFYGYSEFRDFKKLQTVVPDVNGIISNEEIKDFYARWGSSFLFGVVWSKVYRRNFLLDNSVLFDTNQRWCEDLTFNLRVFSNNPLVRFVDKPLYRYNTFSLSDSLTHTREYDLERRIDLIETNSSLYEGLVGDSNNVQKSKFGIDQLLQFLKVCTYKYNFFKCCDATKKFLDSHRFVRASVIEGWNNRKHIIPGRGAVIKSLLFSFSHNYYALGVFLFKLWGFLFPEVLSG